MPEFAKKKWQKVHEKCIFSPFTMTQNPFWVSRNHIQWKKGPKFSQMLMVRLVGWLPPSYGLPDRKKPVLVFDDFPKLFEGKLLRRFDPANFEWQILHHTHWSNSGSIKWGPEFSAPVCPPTMPTNHVLNSPSADRSIAFLLISWVKWTVEAFLSLGSNLFK